MRSIVAWPVGFRFGHGVQVHVRVASTHHGWTHGQERPWKQWCRSTKVPTSHVQSFVRDRPWECLRSGASVGRRHGSVFSSDRVPSFPVVPKRLVRSRRSCSLPARSCCLPTTHATSRTMVSRHRSIRGFLPLRASETCGDEGGRNRRWRSTRSPPIDVHVDRGETKGAYGPHGPPSSGRHR